ncbi:transporter [uncultured Vibrio sp.]|uniref:transporter n=1 Tax=uncultured Vibrio sp. TaxID=114054 RepID=UPI00091309E2|nr:transporter [uncultured Vibrio sp.]OIQ26620.1 MAG: transporter [Vibrio sp. MedPE-SWchi]
MDKQAEQYIVFDYTSFLGASCTKKWTFLEAMSSIAPMFSERFGKSSEKPVSAEDRLWASALQSLSPSYSDEMNLLTLVKLAKGEGIDRLKVVMPYSLEQEQLDAIQQQCELAIDNKQQEEFVLHL